MTDPEKQDPKNQDETAETKPSTPFKTKTESRRPSFNGGLLVGFLLGLIGLFLIGVLFIYLPMKTWMSS